MLCNAWQQAEIEAANGELTKHRAAEILNETLRRIGRGAIEGITTRDWLEDWLEGKQGISPATRLGYKQAMGEFLVHLGPQGEHRLLETITEADIRGFAALLRKEGRSGEITRRVTNHAAGGVVDRYIHQNLAALREAVKLIPRLPEVRESDG